MIESKLEVSNHISDVLRAQLDDMQQYSRRNCLIIENVPHEVGEKIQDIEEKTNKILQDKLKFSENNITNEFDKAHRLGKNEPGNPAPVIVRFKSHSFRAKVFNKRKELKKDGDKSIKIKVCLTKERKKLLNVSKTKLEGNEKVHFVYANINGDIKVRLHHKVNNKNVYDIKNNKDIEEIMIKLDDSKGSIDERMGLNISDDDEL